jgi:PAS domain S-box-containing protein
MPDKHKKPQAKITKPPTGKKPTPKSTTSATKPKKDFRNTGIITSASGLEALGAEESLRITLDYTYGWEYWIAPDGRILYMSPSCQRITGHKREDFIKKPVLLDEIIHPDDREMLAGHNETIDQGPLFTTRYRINTKNDGIRWIEHVCQAVFGEDGTWLGRRASNRDINEQKRAEEEVLRINRELRAISDCNQAMVRAKSEYELCTEVCRIMCEKAGYRMAWVGIAEHDKAKSVRPCGCGGAEDGYLSEITVTWADNELGRGPTGLAIRKGKTQFMQDFDSVPSGAPWRKAALARGYRSSIALPLKDANGKTFAAFMLYADQTNAFIPAEVKLLEELAGDLAFGIMAISDRMNREKAEVALKESEEKFRAISNYSQVLIAVNSIEDGTIIYTNPSYAEAFGYSQDEMLGKKSSELFLNPDERNRGVEKLLTNGYIKDIEFQVKRKDGSPFWVSTSATLIEYAGKKVVLVASLDITERKQAQLALEESEEKFRAVAENAQVMIGLSSLADGTILYVNPRYLATYGFTPEELIGKKGPSLFVDPKARKILVEMLSKHG